MKMYCDTNQFPALLFCVSHPKPHVERGMGKNYHLRFDPNLGHGICAIRRIPFPYVAFTSIFEKTWIYGIQSTIHARYQPVTNCNYWIILDPYNNWNSIELTPKSIPFEAFDDIHKVVVGLPWEPDGRRTDAPLNEDQNEDQVSTYPRGPRCHIDRRTHPSEVQKSLCRATYLR